MVKLSDFGELKIRILHIATIACRNCIAHSVGYFGVVFVV